MRQGLRGEEFHCVSACGQTECVSEDVSIHFERYNFLGIPLASCYLVDRTKLM